MAEQRTCGGCRWFWAEYKEEGAKPFRSACVEEPQLCIEWSRQKHMPACSRWAAREGDVLDKLGGPPVEVPGDEPRWRRAAREKAREVEPQCTGPGTVDVHLACSAMQQCELTSLSIGGVRMQWHYVKEDGNTWSVFVEVDGDGRLRGNGEYRVK